MLNNKKTAKVVKPPPPKKYSVEYPDLTQKMANRYKLLKNDIYTTEELKAVFIDSKQEVQNVIRSLLKLGYVRFTKTSRYGGIYTVIRK